MQFHTLRTQYQWAKAVKRTDAKTHNEYATRSAAMLDAMCLQQYGKSLIEVDPFTPIGLMEEALWVEKRMPYYNLWPNIIPALTQLKLDVAAHFFCLPITPLLVRFPAKVAHPLTWFDDGKEYSIRTMMVTDCEVQCDPEKAALYNLPPRKNFPALAFWLDIGEAVDLEHPEFRRNRYQHLLKAPGWTIEQSFREIPPQRSATLGVVYPDEIMKHCARIACTLCLMAADPELVQPDVLGEDRAKYAQSGDSRLVEKAHRRGKVGWNVGANIEVSPHYRNASPAALYWTGQGRKVPRIRFRKGCFIHKHKFSAVPTGFLAQPGEQL